MRTIPLIGSARFSTIPEGRQLHQSGAGTWAIHEADGAQVRFLNSYEASFVNSAIAACASQEAKGCAQVRRDLVAARETTARTMTAWREALGAEQHHDLAAITAEMVRLGDLYRSRLEELSRGEKLVLDTMNGVSLPLHMYTNGYLYAAHMMRGVKHADAVITETPLVWARDRDTLRGRYRLSRARRSSILGAACEALGGWILNEPAVS